MCAFYKRGIVFSALLTVDATVFGSEILVLIRGNILTLFEVGNFVQKACSRHGVRPTQIVTNLVLADQTSTRDEPHEFSHQSHNG